LTPPWTRGTLELMKALMAMIALVLPLTAAERVEIYMELTQDQVVHLTDGSKWKMDKGDCFPIVAYKESHTKVILQLASAQFMVESKFAREVPEKQKAGAVEKYRANVNTYLNGAAARWKEEAEKGKSEKDKEKK
jgi:hypothetical protein